MNFLRAACVAVGLLGPCQAAAESLPVAPAPAPQAKAPSKKAEGPAQRARVRAQEETTLVLKKHLEFLAILWDEVGRTLEEAVKEEAEADRQEQEVIDLDDRSKRALLLIEQTEARRARALSRLRELETSPGSKAAQP